MGLAHDDSRLMLMLSCPGGCMPGTCSSSEPFVGGWSANRKLLQNLTFPTYAAEPHAAENLTTGSAVLTTKRYHQPTIRRIVFRSDRVSDRIREYVFPDIP